MTNNSIVPFQLRRLPAPAGRRASYGGFAGIRHPAAERGAANCVAVVIYTRTYPAANVLQALVQMGFLTVERPAGDDAPRVIADLGPSLVVLAVDPWREEDVRLLRAIMKRTSAAALALVPAFEPALAARLLDAGADVCLQDSETPELLSAQLGALASWCGRFPSDRDECPGWIVVGDIVLDLDRRRLFRGDVPVGLTPVEFRILEMLAMNAGTVCSSAELSRQVRGRDCSIAEAREWAKVSIRRIRQKLEDDPARPEHVVNVRGFGYLMAPASEPNGHSAPYGVNGHGRRLPAQFAVSLEQGR
jgi:DNA-binding response OmpR family regulator